MSRTISFRRKSRGGHTALIMQIKTKFGRIRVGWFTRGGHREIDLHTARTNPWWMKGTWALHIYKIAIEYLPNTTDAIPGPKSGRSWSGNLRGFRMRWGMEWIKIKVTVGRCNYCGSQAVLINDYGACPKGCPGYFSQCKDFECEVPENILLRHNDKPPPHPAKGDSA